MRNEPDFWRAGRLGPAHRVKQSQFRATRTGRHSVVQTKPIALSSPSSRFRETKPIRPGRVSGEEAQPPIRWRAGSTEDRLRQTKPNLGRMGKLGGASWRLLCQTKPISGHASGPGLSCTNKANWAEPRVQNEANLGGVSSVKRRVLTRASRAGSLLGARTSHFTLQTRPKADRAKQTQLPEAGHRGGVRASGRCEGRWIRSRRADTPFLRATPNYHLTLSWAICIFACFPNVGKVRPCCDCRFGTAPRRVIAAGLRSSVCDP
jgi:hypothetical protein